MRVIQFTHIFLKKRPLLASTGDFPLKKIVGGEEGNVCFPLFCSASRELREKEGC